MSAPVLKFLSVIFVVFPAAHSSFLCPTRLPPVPFTICGKRLSSGGVPSPPGVNFQHLMCLMTCTALHF